MLDPQLQSKIKKSGKVTLAIAGTPDEFDSWLKESGKSQDAVFHVTDEDQLRLLQVHRVEEIVKIGTYYDHPAACCSKIKVLEAELRDWQKQFHR